MLGFQFESQTTPFSVCKFVQSLLIFAVIYLESAIETREPYIIYFSVCFALELLAWAIFLKFFKVLPKETIAEMRKRRTGPRHSESIQLSAGTGQNSERVNLAPVSQEAEEKDNSKGDDS